MRISDWSSDVCSSDLNRARRGVELVRRVGQLEPHELGRAHEPLGVLVQLEGLSVVNPRPLDYTARVIQAVRDRKRVVEGKRVAGRVDLGCRRIITKNTITTTEQQFERTQYRST